MLGLSALRYLVCAKGAPAHIQTGQNSQTSRALWHFLGCFPAAVSSDISSVHPQNYQSGPILSTTALIYSGLTSK